MHLVDHKVEFFTHTLPRVFAHTLPLLAKMLSKLDSIFFQEACYVCIYNPIFNSWIRHCTLVIIHSNDVALFGEKSFIE